jgi:hypothetical protein
MPMVAQPLSELPKPGKMDYRLVAVLAKNKMPNVGSSRNGFATIGISQPSHCDIPWYLAQYDTFGEIESESSKTHLENHRWMCYRYSSDYSLETANFTSEKKGASLFV